MSSSTEVGVVTANSAPGTSASAETLDERKKGSAMTMRTMTFGGAIGEGLLLEMERDDRVFVIGEGVGPSGGSFGVTKAAYDRFGPSRLYETPISETAIVGSAVGAAMAGLRPVAEVMFIDFIGTCFDEILNQAAKLHYMTGGNALVPLVIRTTDGAGNRAAAQHSQSLETLVAHIPGLRVVMPSTPADAKGLIATAVRDDNPVVFIENKSLYRTEGEVPEGEHLVPFGRAEVRRTGSDVTIVTWSAMVHQALAAAESLATEGVEAEVIDLRTLVPLDKATVLESLAKTNRIVIVHEAVRTCGFGAEVAALVADEGFDLLDAPVRRVTAPDTPVPFSPVLEDAFLPNAEKIEAAIRSMI
jgi:pyruvate/2-oxoglutarate/acetoin dehydrogenase E1 component